MKLLPWTEVQTRICDLYSEGTGLTELIDIIAKETGFRASTRAYRMRLSEWQPRKHKTGRGGHRSRLPSSSHRQNRLDGWPSKRNRRMQAQHATVQSEGSTIAALSVNPLQPEIAEIAGSDLCPVSERVQNTSDVSDGCSHGMIVDRVGAGPTSNSQLTPSRLVGSQHTQNWDDTLTHIQRQMSRKALGWLIEDYSLRDGQDTLLHALARRPEYRKISYELLRQMQLWSFNVDIKDARGSTALHLAIIHHCHDKLSQLLGSGASISCPNAQGLTPLDIAIQHGNRTASEALIRAGAALPTLNDIGRRHLFPIVERMLNDSIDAMEGPALDGVRLGCTLGSCIAAHQYYYNHTGGETLAKLLVDVTTDEDLERLSDDVLHPCRARSQSANYSSARRDIFEQVLQRRLFMTAIEVRHMAHQIIKLPPSNDKIKLLEVVCKQRCILDSGQNFLPEFLGSDPRILRSLVALESPLCYDAAALLFGDPIRLRQWLFKLLMSPLIIGMPDQPSDLISSSLPGDLEGPSDHQGSNHQELGSYFPSERACVTFYDDRELDLTEYWVSHRWHEYSRPAALERLNAHLRCGLNMPGIAAAACGGAMNSNEKRTAYRAMQCIVHVVSKQALEFAETSLVDDMAASNKLTVDALKARQRFGLPKLAISSQHLLQVLQTKVVSCTPVEYLFGKG